MAGIQQPAFLNLPPDGKLGFQPTFQFNWRQNPNVGYCRKFVKDAILAYLLQMASGDFMQEIPSLATWMEDELFQIAHSQEDYMDQDMFRKRLRSLIDRRWCETQLDHSSEPLSMNTTPTFGMIKSADTGSILVSSGNLRGFYLSGDVPKTGLRGPRKRTFSATMQQPTEGFPCPDPVDSGPTFSGSVLQYDSEASSESHRRKSQHVGEGDLNLIVSNDRSPPSMVSKKSYLEASPICNEVNVPDPSPEHQQLKEQFLQHNVLFDRRISGKFEPSERSSMQNKIVCAHQTGEERTLPLSNLDLSGQHTFHDVLPPMVNKLLFSYRAYHKNLVQKVPFLEWFHSLECSGGMCHCESYRKLLAHFENCGLADCGVCGPSARTNLDASEVLNSRAKSLKLNVSYPRFGSSHNASRLPEDLNGLSGPLNVEGKTGSQVMATSLNPKYYKQVFSSHANGHTEITKIDNRSVDDELESNFDGAGNPAEGLCNKDIESGAPHEVKVNTTANVCKLPSYSVPSLSEGLSRAPNKEKMNDQEGTESKPMVAGSESLVSTLTEMKSEKQRVNGISLIDYFTADEIRQHISGLKLKVDQGKAEGIVGNTAACSVSENFCQLCTLDKLSFPPMPIYCSSCGLRIKYDQSYYLTPNEERAQFCFCSRCYHSCRGGNITFHGSSISKSSLQPKKNDSLMEESWVQCDKCEGWQHQICGLFNDKRDLGGKAEYICPKCHLDLGSVEGMTLSRNTSLDASKLRKTFLSDHLEGRLFARLKQEREHQAQAMGINPEEVPQPADLVVRVVSSVDKILKVKQDFLDIFPEKHYPEEFPYRSKVILLFQRIEGVDVCLFAMYVQEFGSECSRPNQRCVYISYLDSVKYFRPETKTVKGEALRTVVYHELLVGYLEYCKKRGFATCYIWACPPVKGEDYIMYCHPESQKTPRPEKLRQWYQSMLKKATEQKIVVSHTNLYEEFFVADEESNTKVTAARLPYFVGDVCSGLFEILSNQLKKDGVGDPEEQIKKLSRRSLKSMGHINPGAHEAKDILLMKRLSEKISSAKEDFILVHLRFMCRHCHEVILSGKRWFCNQCKNYQLCERCHGKQENSEQQGTHISNSGQKHALSEEIVNDVPLNTEDGDAIIENCFLENRNAFLNFCQGNHYQFDSLRRAKHSSMMILYHLHNPSGSNVGAVCSLCLKDIDADSKWTCEMCPDFIVCSTCYQRSNATCHSHTLILHLPSVTDVERKLRMVTELRDTVLHAAQCLTQSCSYHFCTPLKRLFAHGHTCRIRASGGCKICERVWYTVKVHCMKCKDIHCPVPRCRDIQEHLKRHKSKLSFGHRNVLPNASVQSRQ